MDDHFVISLSDRRKCMEDGRPMETDWLLCCLKDAAAMPVEDFFRLIRDGKDFDKYYSYYVSDIEKYQLYCTTYDCPDDEAPRTYQEAACLTAAMLDSDVGEIYDLGRDLLWDLSIAYELVKIEKEISYREKPDNDAASAAADTDRIIPLSKRRERFDSALSFPAFNLPVSYLFYGAGLLDPDTDFETCYREEAEPVEKELEKENFFVNFQNTVLDMAAELAQRYTNEGYKHKGNDITAKDIRDQKVLSLLILEPYRNLKIGDGI